MSTFYSTLVVLQWVAALIIIIESINKSHQCAIMRAAITPMHRISLVFKAVAWVCIAMAAGGVLISPVLREVPMSSFSDRWINPQPSVSECGLFIAVSILIVRSWIIVASKEASAALFKQAGCSQSDATGKPTTAG